MITHRETNSPLWAVTSFYNPAGYRHRRENYRVFRQHLNVPLVCVEQSCTGQFELGAEDADILLQITGDCMWQKERLLNIAIAAAPATCGAIAWLDCDVIFARHDWVELTLEQLDRAPLVQVYNTRLDLPRSARVALPDIDPPMRAMEAAVPKLEREATLLGPHERLLICESSPGLAWAARRDLLDEHGLYDACILGTGDHVYLSASYGLFEQAESAVGMNAWQVAHFRAWAEPFHRSVAGRIGHVPGDLYHLWHGDFENRRYMTRYQGLAPYDFDPAHDLACDAQGSWRWNTPKPAMHAYVRQYFDSRREDG